ncbi:hypothetical protein [Pseudomonas citronellolis]|uniref:hypothetical protein n=1 Tax=Pseudomonas citronellolis TaxID=53408 RepID=UPI00209C70EC|nr:hypothetical protein [Pseudomonas citronellolis]MCP1606462.1 hypothetical protein [Pseudomonas citronellolis]MCP1657168.1 hypothetical protein [Pseudomonas citronellolis]MCP1724099.1 hypothetical protein [Pseudomonas citronellolis]
MKLYHLVIPLALIAAFFPTLGAKLLAGLIGLAVVLWLIVLLSKPLFGSSEKPRR